MNSLNIDNVFKLEPTNFILKMNKNGIIKEKEIELLKIHAEKVGFENLDEEISKTYNLFKNIENYGVNVIYYMIIFKNISLQQIKNLYRFFLMKWNIVKNRKDYLKKIDLKYKLEDIITIVDYKNLIMFFTETFIEFINNGEFFFLFFINTFHEYLSPNTH